MRYWGKIYALDGLNMSCLLHIQLYIPIRQLTYESGLKEVCTAGIHLGFLKLHMLLKARKLEDKHSLRMNDGTEREGH